VAEEYAISRGERDYTDPRARLTPFDETEVRAALVARGLDLEGGDEGVLEAGDGSVFWQVELVRDGAGRVIAVAGDMYYDNPTYSRDAARLLHEMIRGLASVLDATPWVYPGPRVLDAAEMERMLGA
jgi:hypothetical protein